MYVSEQIINEYAEKRQKKQRELEARQKLIFETVPHIGELWIEIKKAAFELGAKAFCMSEEEFEKCRTQTQQFIDETNEKIQKLLDLNGFPADSLELHYDCPKCKDTGYTDAGHTSPCSCLQNRIAAYQFANSLVNQYETFERFDSTLFSDIKQLRLMEKVRDYAISYCDMLPKPNPINLLLIGQSGLGKSFILNSIAKRAIEKGFRAYKITAYNLVESCLSAIRQNKEKPDYLCYDLLLIDDLGSEPWIKNVTVEQLFTIINDREILSKPTVISTNLTPDDMHERYNERIISRFISPQNTKVFMLRGEDLRFAKKENV